MSDTEQQEGRYICPECGEFHDPEVYKVIGAPGTGKTTRVVGNPALPDVESLVIENLEEYPIEDQLIVTYTNAGVDEAADRLKKILGAPQNLIDQRVVTIHAHCYRTLGVDRDEVVRWWHKQDFCKRNNLQYGRDGDDGDIMSSEQDEGHALFDIYNWLKSNRKPLEKYEDCPADYPGTEDVLELMERWEAYKSNPPDKDSWKNNPDELIDFADMIERVVEWGKGLLHDEGFPKLFGDNPEDAMETFEETRHIRRFNQEEWRGRGPFADTRVLYVDEVQDLTPLQWTWYLMQKLVAEKVYIGGDDDQCLPPNAPVEVRDIYGKEYQKPIKDVQIGEGVRTMLSNGDVEYRSVSDVIRKDVEQKRFRVIKTESGKLTAVTDNHKMFTRIPEAEYDSISDKHYVYLMRDNEDNWRIGETNDLRQRLNVERGARCILPLEPFDNREEALEKELEWSLKYSIPQLTIQQRDGELLSDPEIRNRIYDAVNPQYDEIERDFGVDIYNPPLYKKSTTRGRTESVNINIKMCADMRNTDPRHNLNITTSNDHVKHTISNEIDELTESESGSGSTRFRTSSTDIKHLGYLAKEVKRLVSYDDIGADIITVMSPTEERSNAVVTPSGNLVEGMLIPVVDEGEVVWEEIIEIKDRKETTEVYDLTVPGTHNFTSGGIGVHNTIYGWAGANPNFMLDEEGDFEVLEKTYRIPSSIWEVCDGVIRQVDKRQEKEVEPYGRGGDVVVMRSPAPSRVMEHIQGRDAMVLFRARYMIDEFRKHLHSYGIPYRNMSTYDTWSDDVTTIRNALSKMRDGDEDLTSEEVDTLIDHAVRECIHCEGKGCNSCSHEGEASMLSENNSYDGKEAALGMIGSGHSPERVKKIFDLSTDYRDYEFSSELFISQTDELNYYEKQAIKGSLSNNSSHLEPDRLRIGTIHSAKGKEAPVIVLATDSTQRIIEEMIEDTSGRPDKRINDAERRVYYVGMTRASEKLVLCQGLIDAEFCINIPDLLEDYEEPEDEWATDDSVYRSDW